MTAHRTAELKSEGFMARPSKYDPAYCDEMVVFCSDGSSLASYAAHIDVCRDTLSEWGKQHDEFSVAIKRAKAKIAAWYDKAARKSATDGGGNAALCIFGLKNFNSEDFRDKIETEHSGTLRVDRVERHIVRPANSDG